MHNLKFYIWTASTAGDQDLTNFIPANSRVLGVICNSVFSAGSSAQIAIFEELLGINQALVWAITDENNVFVSQWFGNDNDVNFFDNAHTPLRLVVPEIRGQIPKGLPLKWSGSISDIKLQVNVMITNGVLTGLWYTDSVPSPSSGIRQ